MVKKTREVTIRESGGAFGFFSGDKKVEKQAYDFDGLDSLRKLLSKEKARILDAIKYKKPGSIYELSKTLKRPFKAVFDDVKLLQRFGLVEIKEEKINNRIRHKPIIVTDHLTIHLRI